MGTVVMNVLYYLGTFPKLSASFVLNEIYELESKGHNVAVFAIDNPNEEIEHEEYDALDIPVRYADSLSYASVLGLVSTKVLHPSVLKHALFRARPRRHAMALHRSKQCIEFVEEADLDIDLVHTHFATMGTFPARYVASYYGVPSSVTAHAFDLYNDPDEAQLRQFLSEPDQVITISEYNRKYIRDEITNTTPISVVHAGIRPEKFEPTPSAVDGRVLTVARFVEKKGLLDAVRGLSRVVEEFPHLDYHVVGSGPLEAEIREQIDESDLNDNVELLGNVDDERLVAEYDEASCFLLPCTVTESGDRDGIPVALMEAIAMETPPVSTRVSGISELIDHGENGLLVEPGDIEGLADAVSSVLADEQRRRAFGEAGRRKVKEEFNVERECSKLESVFARMGGRGQRSSDR